MPSDHYFIALPLPPQVTTLLSRLFVGLPNARWERPEQLHLTLRFLGPLHSHLLQDAQDLLSEILAPSVTLALQGVDSFSHKDRRGSRQCVLWVGCAFNDDIQRLQAEIERVAHDLGLPPEKRTFRPHVTIGRTKGEREERLARYLRDFAHFRAEPTPIDEMVLYRSHRTNEGAIYYPEAVYPLVV